jgi:hypothetical protein
MDPFLHMFRAVLLAARGEVAAALEEDEFQVDMAHNLDPQSTRPSLAYSSFLRAAAGERETAGARLEELLRLWRKDPQTVTFNPSVLAFAAVSLGRQDEFLAVAGGARATRWLEAGCAFARREYVRAAELFSAIGSRPSEAYARLSSGEPAQVQLALEFYRSVGAAHFVRQAEALLPASA